jgi:hypothetical protein
MQEPLEVLGVPFKKTKCYFPTQVPHDTPKKKIINKNKKDHSPIYVNYHLLPLKTF